MTLVSECSGERCAPRNRLCTCRHFHPEGADACTEKLERGRPCPCKAYTFDKAWRWFWSHPDMRDELDAGGDLHHAHTSCLWQLLTFDHDQIAEYGRPQLTEAQRGRLLELARARGTASTGRYDLWIEAHVPYEYEPELEARERLEAWLAQPLSDRQWAAAAQDRKRAELAAEAKAAKAAAAAAVAAGTYTGPAQQGTLL